VILISVSGGNNLSISQFGLPLLTKTAHFVHISIVIFICS